MQRAVPTCYLVKTGAAPLAPEPTFLTGNVLAQAYASPLKFFTPSPESGLHSSRLPLDNLATEQLAAWMAQARIEARTGQVPAYIPRLAEANPDWLALQLQCINGETKALGDTDRAFALMSVIKPFVLLYLLHHYGEQTVFTKVGMLPSDLPFHSVAQLSADGGFPRNPMINSGAIALASLLPGATGRDRCQTLCQWLNDISGAKLWLDETMLASVRSVGNETNRALATLLRSANVIDAVDTTLDTYNQICCLSGTVDDLARLGLLLASGQFPIAPAHQRSVNALMLTCGLYETSGAFAVQLGLPTKSGVSGALLAVLPRQGAIACYSPALDTTGNSIAGILVLMHLVRSLDLSIFG